MFNGSKSKGRNERRFLLSAGATCFNHTRLLDAPDVPREPIPKLYRHWDARSRQLD